MADNYTISSVVFASDDISGVQYPRIAVTWGDDGTKVDASLTAPLPVQIPDDISISGLVPGVTATSLGKAEDSAHASGDTGVMMLAVRKDSAGSLAGTDLDYAPPQLDSTGALRVVLSGSGFQQYAEDTAHVSGDFGMGALGVRRDTASSLAGTDGDYTLPIYDASNRLHVNVGAATATEISTDSIGVTETVGTMVERTSAGTYTVLTVKRATIAASSSGNTTLVAAVTSKRIRVIQGMLWSAGTVTASIQDGAGGSSLSGSIPLTAQTGFLIPYNPHGAFWTTAGTLLNINLSGAVAVAGYITYVETTN